MAEKEPRPIVIKRIKKVAGGHHGGAWKIAYADFVTAMMAFFLLMWLLGSVDGGKLNGISEYFKMPLKAALAGGSSSGESTVVLKGGGQDPTAEAGLVRNGQPAQTAKKDAEKIARAAQERLEAAQMRAMKDRLEKLIDNSPQLRPFKKQLLIDITSEGLRVQIVDEKNRPMFALSSAELQAHTREILRQIAPVLNDMPNRISLSGHTDAHAYSNGGQNYSNWELSADRANAARRTLVAGGLLETHLMRVIGLSSAVLLDPQDALNPINRRISIILLNKRAEEAAVNEGRREVSLTPTD
jgi:chemotaxis protein MotB